MLEIKVVCFDDKYLAFIGGDPFVISVIKIAQIFDADAFSYSLPLFCICETSVGTDDFR